MKTRRSNRFLIVTLSVITLSLLALFYRSDSALMALTESSSSSAVFAPIAVVKSNPTLTTDGNGNGVINPGDTLTYSVTVSNGATDTSGVIFQDVLNSNLTLVAGSVNSTPIAANESYSVLGNVSINVPVTSGVKINDSDPDGTTPTITGFGSSLANANATAAGSAGASAQGGNITLNADGSFTYNPPAGYEGADSFFYTLRDAGADGTFNNADDATDTAQVTLNISGMIWFINNAATACTTRVSVSGCGRLSNPYSSLASFQTENNGTGNNPAAGDNIFIYTGSINYDASITLLNNQKLIGQGANTALTGAGSITGLTLPSFSSLLPTIGGTNPTIITTAAATNALNLGQGNTIRGLTIGNTTASKLNATATVGTANIGSPSGASDVTLNGSGQAINFTGGGTLAARFASITSTNANQAAATTGITLTGMSGSLVSPTTTITNPNGIGINVSSSTAGAGFDFGNTTVNQSGGSGVSLASNIGAITFADLDIAPDSGQRGLQATNNTGTITTTSGTFSTTNGTAIEITGVSAASKTPLNITLTSVSVSGSASGIMLTNTSSAGSPGGFKIVGSASTAASGGTISNISGADGSITAGVGVYLDNVSDITLTNMTFSGTFGNFGIRGQNVTNFTLRDSSLGGTFGSNDSLDEGTIRFGTENFTTGIKGTALFEGNVIGGGWENNLSVYLYGSDTLNMTVQDSANDPAVFNAQSSSFGDDALHVESGGTGSNLTLLVNGVAFNAARGDQLQVGQIGVTTQTLTITNNQFHNTASGIVSGGGGVWILGGSLANTSNVNVTYNFSNNSIKNSQGDCFRAVYTGYAATISGLILNNTIGTANGVFETNTNSGSVGAGDGISVGHAKGALTGFSNSGTINHAVRIEGNTIRDINNGTGGIRVTNGSKAGGTSRLEATVKNNTVAEGGPDLLSGFYGIVGANGSGDISKTGLVITGNTFTAGTGTGGSAIYLDQISTATTANYYIPGYTINANSSHGENNPPAGGGTASANLDTFWSSNNTLINGPFPFNGKKVDAQITINIANSAFILGVPSFALTSPAEERSNQATVALDKFLNFKNISYQSPLEILASIEPFFKHSTNREIVSPELIKQPEIAIEKEKTVEIDVTSGTQDTNHWSKVSSLVGNFSVVLREFAGKLGSTISPTVIAQEVSREAQKGQIKQGQSRDNLLAPEAGETVCVDGNTDTSSCAGGFTIPANESTTITFRAVVNANSTATSIPNTASAGGVNSNTVTTTVVQPPSVSKDFVATFISVGGTTSLNFTITNPNPSTQLTGVSLTDVLPAGLSVTGATSSACGGTNNLVVTAATRTIQFSGGTIASGGNCQFSVMVTGAAEGLQNNVTGNVSSTNGGAGNTATDTVTVIRPPTLAKSFTPNQIQLNATSSLQFTLANPNTTLALSTLVFADSLPLGVTAPNTAATTVCTDGSYSIAGNVISFTKPSLAGGTNCVFSITVTGSTAGLKINTTGTVTTANSNAGTAATATLTVIAPPTISKVFGSPSITAGGQSTVTLTLSNSNASALTGASFTDTLTNMSAVGGTVTGNCVGTTPMTLSAGATALSFTGITIPASGSCTVIFSVTSSTAGVNPNTTSGVTTTQTSTAGATSNTVSLTVTGAPQIAKSFSPSSIAVNGTSTLTLTITNPAANTAALTGVGVNDSFPAGMEVAATPAATNSCTTGTFAPVAGASSISITGATIPVNTSCIFTVGVKGTSLGDKLNTTGAVTSANGGTGTTAAATLSVKSLEADTAARPNGDVLLQADDVIQIRRFLNGSDTANTLTDEFQRADSAPYATKGDGMLASDDVVQARRYITTDAQQTAGGPTAPVAPPAAAAALEEKANETPIDSLQIDSFLAGTRQVRVENASASAGSTVTVNIRVDAMGDESEYAFVLNYQAPLSNPVVSSGTAGSFLRNCNVMTAGQVNCSVGGFANENPASNDTGIGEIASGMNQLLLKVTFTIAANAVAGTTTPLTLTNVNASNDTPQLLMITSQNGMVTIAGTTAAKVSVAGRVLTAKGAGIRNVVVSLTDSNGEVRTTTTNESGYYRFNNVEAGESYIITATGKRYSFSQPSQLLNINEEIEEVNFIANPVKRYGM